MRLGLTTLSLSRGGGATSAGQIITATVSPTLGPLTDADTPADAFTTGTYASTAGDASVDATVALVDEVEQSMGGALTEGEVVRVRQDVVDDADPPNSRSFFSVARTVTYIAPVAAGTLEDVLIVVDEAMTPVDVSADFTGDGITYELAPASDPLPAGVSLSSGGSLSGTPTVEVEDLTIIVRGTNSGGFDDTEFGLTVSEELVAMTVDSVPDDADRLYDYTPGNSAMTFTITAAPHDDLETVASFSAGQRPVQQTPMLFVDPTDPTTDAGIEPDDDVLIIMPFWHWDRSAYTGDNDSVVVRLGGAVISTSATFTRENSAQQITVDWEKRADDGTLIASAQYSPPDTDYSPEAPSLTNETIRILRDRTTSIDVLAIEDPDDQVVTAVEVTGGTVTVDAWEQGDRIIPVAAPDSFETAELTVTIENSTGGSDDKIVTLPVGWGELIDADTVYEAEDMTVYDPYSLVTDGARSGGAFVNGNPEFGGISAFGGQWNGGAGDFDIAVDWRQRDVTDSDAEFRFYLNDVEVDSQAEQATPNGIWNTAAGAGSGAWVIAAVTLADTDQLRWEMDYGSVTTYPALDRFIITPVGGDFADFGTDPDPTNVKGFSITTSWALPEQAASGSLVVAFSGTRSNDSAPSVSAGEVVGHVQAGSAGVRAASIIFEFSNGSTNGGTVTYAGASGVVTVAVELEADGATDWEVLGTDSDDAEVETISCSFDTEDSLPAVGFFLVLTAQAYNLQSYDGPAGWDHVGGSVDADSSGGKAGIAAFKLHKPTGGVFAPSFTNTDPTTPTAVLSAVLVVARGAEA